MLYFQWLRILIFAIPILIADASLSAKAIEEPLVSKKAKEKKKVPFDKDCPKTPAPKIRKIPVLSKISTKEHEDPNEEISSISTDIVNKEFLASDEKYFIFLKETSEILDGLVEQYRIENKLEKEAIFLVIKGGNVLRMIANKSMGALPLEASAFLKFHYFDYFKRSDTDFSVYIDPGKIGKLDFNKVFNEISDRVFKALNKLRDKFIAQPENYFDFFNLDKKEIPEVLSKYLSLAKDIEAINNPSNEQWYKVNFNQLQLLDFRANEHPYCPYIGQYDFKYDIRGNILSITPISKKPSWLAITDNRSVAHAWAADPKKESRFALLREIVSFLYGAERFGEPELRSVGGELIDVTVIHQDDDSLKEFLINYDDNVVLYEITSNSLDEHFFVQGFSVSYLAQDLFSIFFETFDRPWKMGPKYEKRLYRFFFLSIIEMLGAYGLGSKKIANYIDAVKEELLGPMSKVKIENIEQNAQKLSKLWPKLKETNRFFVALARVYKAAEKSPEEGDKEGFKELLEIIGANLDIAKKLSTMPAHEFLIPPIYQVNMDDL